MANEHQHVLGQRGDMEARVFLRISYQADIGHAGDDIFVQLCRPSVFYGYIYSGVFLEKFFQVRRQLVEADTIDRYDLDVAGDDILDLLNFMAKLVVGLHDLLAIFVECLAFLGKREFLFSPLN